jgi:starch-binding outer membrane protein, SusD/RagB family
MKVMKKSLIYSLFAALFFFSACSEDLLDLNNPNAPTVAQFWKTEFDAQQGLNAVYGMFYKPGTWSRWMYFRQDLASDEGYSNSPWTELKEWTRFQYFNYNFWEGGSWIWRDHYKAIFRANQVLAYVPEITFADENKKKQIIAQAKFLRAFYYFQVAVLWENVPLVLEPSKPGDLPLQKTEAEVWAQIKKDLTDASADLPAEWDAAQKGRITKGAALALLGKAHMQTGNWAEAKTALSWLVEGDGKALYDIIPNYKDNFTHTAENNKESVFEIQFSDVNQGGDGDESNPNLGSNRAQFFAPRGIGWCDGQPRKWIINVYKAEMNTDGKYDERLKENLFYKERSVDFPGNDMIYGRLWDNGQWGDDAFIRKYQGDYYRNREDYYSPINYRVIRFADVLLCYAECLAQLGGATPSALAIECVDRVRQRPSTKLPKLANSTVYADAVTTKEKFLKHLQTERALELCYESVRWMDLKRWGMLNTQAGIDELKLRDPDFNFFTLGRSHRLPLPQSEVENNENLKQNTPY